jgi:hypothetical protein
MSENLKFSKFVHFFERDGITAIFHALSRETVFIDQASLVDLQSNLSGALFSDSQSEIISHLKQNGLIIFADFDEIDCIKPFQESILQHPCIDTLFF